VRVAQGNEVVRALSSRRRARLCGSALGPAGHLVDLLDQGL